MLKLAAITALLLGFALLLLGVRMIFKKGGKFPVTSVGGNYEMKKRGITCVKHDENRKLKDCQTGCSCH